MASQGQEQPGHSPEMYMKQNVQDGVENSKGGGNHQQERLWKHFW